MLMQVMVSDDGVMVIHDPLLWWLVMVNPMVWLTMVISESNGLMVMVSDDGVIHDGKQVKQNDIRFYW